MTPDNAKKNVAAYNDGYKEGYRAAIDDVKAQFLKNAETSHGPYSWQAAVMAIDAMSKEG